MSTCEVVAFVQTLQLLHLECVPQTSVFTLDICISVRLVFTGEYFVIFPSAASLASLHAAAVQWMFWIKPAMAAAEEGRHFLVVSHAALMQGLRGNTQRFKLALCCAHFAQWEGNCEHDQKSSTRAEQSLDFVLVWLKIKACSQSRLMYKPAREKLPFLADEKLVEWGVKLNPFALASR